MPAGVRRRTLSRFVEQRHRWETCTCGDHRRKLPPDEREHQAPHSRPARPCPRRFAIGTTEFMSMGLLEKIADGIHSPTRDRPHHHGVRLGGRCRRTGHRLAGCSAAQARAGDRPDPGARRRQCGHRDGQRLPPGPDPAFRRGLPHGAYFGVASLLAASLVRPEYKGRAVSSVMLGLSVATVVGVPASIALGQHLGWRSAYWVVLAPRSRLRHDLWRLCRTRRRPRGIAAGELSALKRPQVLFAVSAGMIGFGGLFAMYSYISPTRHQGRRPSSYGSRGSRSSSASAVLSARGLARCSGRLGLERSRCRVRGHCAALVVFFFASPHSYRAGMILVFASRLQLIVAINLQMRLMHAAGDAQIWEPRSTIHR